MGNVVDFAERAARQKFTKAANDADKAHLLADGEENPRNTPEGERLYQALSASGITVLTDESLRDFRTLMKLVRGMKDRQAGRANSADCAMIECVAQAMGYNKDLPQDDSFDDLLDKLL